MVVPSGIEEALDHPHRRLGALLNNSPLAIAEFDFEMRVTRWSVEAERMFGWAPDEIIGNRISEMKWIYEEDEALVGREVAGLLDGSRYRSLCANRNYRKDGTIIHCEWYNSAIYDSNGKLISILSQVLDVTKHREMEKALKAAEADLRKAQAVAHIGSWGFDPATGATDWSDELFRIFGLPSGDTAPTYEILEAIIHPNDWERFDAAVKRASVEGVGYDLELAFVYPDGEIGYINSICEPVKDGDGKVVRLIGTAQDITEKKRRAAELDALLSATRSVLSVKDFPSCARRIFDDCLRVTGGTAGYVAVRKDKDDGEEILFMDSGGATCAADSTLTMPISSLEAEAYRTGRVVFDNAVSQMLPGGIVTLDNALFAPLMIEGSAKGIVVIANKPSPFTEHDAVMAEAFGEIAAIALKQCCDHRKLVESEEKFSKSFDKSPLIMSINDIDTAVYLEVNEQHEKVFGYTKEETLGRSSTDLGVISDALREQVTSQIKTDGFCKNLEVTVRTKSGEPLICNCFLETIQYGGEQRLLTIAEDVTAAVTAEKERVKLEKQLRQAQKMEALGTLAGGVAHEFNNLLGGIIGYADLIQAYADLGSEYGVYLDRVLQAANRAKELVQQILTFSRHHSAEIASLNPVPIVKDALKMLRSALPSTIEIRDQFDFDCGTVEANPTQFHQILLNLCTNAFQAMETRGGILTVALDRADVMPPRTSREGKPVQRPCLHLSVGDTGCGIPPEVIDNIFDPFFTTKEPGKGTGMGLSIVYGIIKEYGGVISVDSEADRGTTFHVYLPENQAEAEAFF